MNTRLISCTLLFAIVLNLMACATPALTTSTLPHKAGENTFAMADYSADHHGGSTRYVVSKIPLESKIDGGCNLGVGHVSVQLYESPQLAVLAPGSLSGQEYNPCFTGLDKVRPATLPEIQDFVVTGINTVGYEVRLPAQEARGLAQQLVDIPLVWVAAGSLGLGAIIGGGTLAALKPTSVIAKGATVAAVKEAGLETFDDAVRLLWKKQEWGRMIDQLKIGKRLNASEALILEAVDTEEKAVGAAKIVGLADKIGLGRAFDLTAGEAHLLVREHAFPVLKTQGDKFIFAPEAAPKAVVGARPISMSTHGTGYPTVSWGAKTSEEFDRLVHQLMGGQTVTDWHHSTELGPAGSIWKDGHATLEIGPKSPQAWMGSMPKVQVEFAPFHVGNGTMSAVEMVAMGAK